MSPDEQSMKRKKDKREQRNQELVRRKKQINRDFKIRQDGPSFMTKKALRKLAKREDHLLSIRSTDWYQKYIQTCQNVENPSRQPLSDARLENLWRIELQKEEKCKDTNCVCGIRYDSTNPLGPNREQVELIGALARQYGGFDPILSIHHGRHDTMNRKRMGNDERLKPMIKEAFNIWLSSQADSCKKSGNEECSITLNFIRSTLVSMTEWSSWHDALVNYVEMTGSLNLRNEGCLAGLLREISRFHMDIGGSLGKITSQKLLDPLGDPNTLDRDKLTLLTELVPLLTKLVILTISSTEELKKRLKEQEERSGGGFWDRPVGQNALGGTIACVIACIPTGIIVSLGGPGIQAFYQSIKTKLDILLTDGTTTINGGQVNEAIRDVSSILEKVGKAINNIGKVSENEGKVENMNEAIQDLSNILENMNNILEKVSKAVNNVDKVPGNVEKVEKVSKVINNVDKVPENEGKVIQKISQIVGKKDDSGKINQAKSRRIEEVRGDRIQGEEKASGSITGNIGKETDQMAHSKGALSDWVDMKKDSMIPRPKIQRGGMREKRIDVPDVQNQKAIWEERINLPVPQTQRTIWKERIDMITKYEIPEGNGMKDILPIAATGFMGIFGFVGITIIYFFRRKYHPPDTSHSFDGDISLHEIPKSPKSKMSKTSKSKKIDVDKDVDVEMGANDDRRISKFKPLRVTNI